LGILDSNDSIAPRVTGKVPMKRTFSKRIAIMKYAGGTLAGAMLLLVPKMSAQQPDGPQTSPPPEVGAVAR